MPRKFIVQAGPLDRGHRIHRDDDDTRIIEDMDEDEAGPLLLAGVIRPTDGDVVSTPPVVESKAAATGKAPRAPRKAKGDGTPAGGQVDGTPAGGQGDDTPAGGQRDDTPSGLL